jgi:hypothetical protein
MFVTALSIVAVVLLVFSSLLACVLSLTECASFASIRKGVNPGGDAAGFGMGQGYIFIGAIAGALSAFVALLIYTPVWGWSAAVLAVHILVMTGVLATNTLYHRLECERAGDGPRLEVCPRCGAKVRPDRLEKHLNRVHARPR